MSARAKQAYGTHAPLASKGGNTVGMGGMTAKAGVKPNMADTQRVGRGGAPRRRAAWQGAEEPSGAGELAIERLLLKKMKICPNGRRNPV
eukprot:COSAG06_NODE_27139_length_600_cov_0.570858_1_plen_90_part_00